MTRVEPDRDKRSRLIWEARTRGDVSYLIDATRRDDEFQDVAAMFLGRLGDNAAIQPLLDLLVVSDPQVKTAAIRSLGQLRAREASPALFSLASDDPVFYVRAWAMQALAEIGEPEVVPLALKALDDEDARIRRSAAIVLGRVGDESALGHLERARKRDKLFARGLYRDAENQIRRAKRLERRPAWLTNLARLPATRFLKRIAYGALLVLGAVVFGSALILTGAPVWVRAIATGMAFIVWWRYVWIRRHHRARRSRLPLLGVTEPK